MRVAEDVVAIEDSLTALVDVYTTSTLEVDAVASQRRVPGCLNLYSRVCISENIVILKNAPVCSESVLAS